jgi:hypothetical protein
MPSHTIKIITGILDYTAEAAKVLQDVADATQIPFLATVCSLSLSIIPIVQVWNSWSDCRSNAKRWMQSARVQKDRCLRIIEHIHQILCALAGLCIIESANILSPGMLYRISQYAE